jgi:hypothetical protein
MALGSPAFGYACTKHSATPSSAWMKGTMLAAPRAQLSPMQSGLECCIET